MWRVARGVGWHGDIARGGGEEAFRLGHDESGRVSGNHIERRTGRLWVFKKHTLGDCPRHHPLHGAMQRKAAAALALDHDAVVCWSIDRLRFSRCGRTQKYASIKLIANGKTDASTGHLALPAPG